HRSVAITHLQQTDPSLPHYDKKTWTFQRGAMATIDRDLGVIDCYFFYNLIETHVLHHFVPKVPFYHAVEATEAIRTVMGKHYKSDVTYGSLGFFKALWTVTRTC
ncbi:hypothetical protein K505DRAFT_254956, partial [Melanomma pulvis-pyrius CBS 109.77]